LRNTINENILLINAAINHERIQKNKNSDLSWQLIQANDKVTKKAVIIFFQNFMEVFPMEKKAVIFN